MLMEIATTSTTTHVTTLLHYLIGTYFVHLSTVLVVHDNSAVSQSALHQEYLHAVQASFRNQSQHGNIIALQWIEVGGSYSNIDDDNDANGSLPGNFSSTFETGKEKKNDDNDDNVGDFEKRLLAAVDSAPIEGFITILADTLAFLRARSYAMRYTRLRLKDKLYLFLCEDESPHNLLTVDILQFYPNHLMVTPTMDEDEGEGVGQVEVQVRANRTTSAKQTKGAERTTSSSLPPASPSPSPSPSLGSSRTTTIRTWMKLTKRTLNNFTTSIRSIPDGLPPLGGTLFGSVGGSAVTHGNINFELWTQKFVGVAGNLDAVRLNAFLPNETFAIPIVDGVVIASSSNSSSSSRSDSCGTTSSPFYHNSSNLMMASQQLYADKLSNLGGRTLRVGSITYIPYVVTNYVAPGTGNVDPINPNGPQANVHYIGSEAEIVKTFCQIRNCHLRVKPYGPDNWGEIVPEKGIASGMLGGMYQHHVEMAIGCVYNWYNDLTETSHTFARSAVTLLGPAPALYPPWRMHLMPFSAMLWQFLCAMVALCALILFLVRCGQHRYHDEEQKHAFHCIDAAIMAALNILAVFMQQPTATQRLHGFAARFFLAAILCATITLENTYSGQLKSLLTVPLYTAAVDTMEKWSRTDWRWAAPSSIWVQTIEESELVKEQILAAKFEQRDYKFLYNVSFRYDYGLGVERLMSGAFSYGNFVTVEALETKIIPKDDLYFDWVVAATIRGWPLMSIFNMHVRTCMETGLFMHWERQIVAQCLDDQTQEVMLQLASGHIPKRPPQQLTLANVSGPLFALVFGYSMASFIFIFELFSHHFYRRVFV